MCIFLGAVAIAYSFKRSADYTNSADQVSMGGENVQ